MPCPKCGSEYVITYGKNGRRFYECSNNTCTFRYDNTSKKRINVSGKMVLPGKNRRHYKLSKEDYVEIKEGSEDHTIGFLARMWGVSRKQIKRILNLNLSRYAEEIYGEKPIKLNKS